MFFIFGIMIMDYEWEKCTNEISLLCSPNGPKFPCCLLVLVDVLVPAHGDNREVKLYANRVRRRIGISLSPCLLRMFSERTVRHGVHRGLHINSPHIFCLIIYNYDDFKLLIVLKHISTMFNDRSAHSAQCTVHLHVQVLPNCCILRQ